MTYAQFNADQFLPFIIGAVLITVSVVCYHLDRKTAGLMLLFLGSFVLGLFIANLDHFLNLWDEQYHALVAKHMTVNPFKPMLYDNPLVAYDYTNWTRNHIWLHKQPLFLWQIALSLKIFGMNALAVRLPGTLMHAVNTLMVYRIGKISCTERTGYYGALFFTVACYPLELISGRYSTDHNDVAFLFYVTASFWAWFEYRRSGKRGYLVLIGLFAGGAVLVKWMVGMLIYASWMMAIAFGDRVNRLKVRSYYPVAVSLLISFLVFMPWQLYVFSKFPVEARYEFLYTARHFFEPVEGHGGGAWFHFNALNDLYGSGMVVPYILLAGFILFLRNVSSNVYRVAIASAVVITYGFYTVAATKMTSFCIIVSPFAFLGIGSLVDSAANLLKKKVVHPKFDFVSRSVVVLLICLWLADLPWIANFHAGLHPAGNCNRICEFDEMRLISRLRNRLKDEKYVVFNAKVKYKGHIPVMFYTDYIAYDIVPSKEQVAEIRLKDYKIAIVDDGSLPGYITGNAEIVKIKSE